jgi:hypothetical protein
VGRFGCCSARDSVPQGAAPPQPSRRDPSRRATLPRSPATSLRRAGIPSSWRPVADRKRDAHQIGLVLLAVWSTFAHTTAATVPASSNSELSRTNRASPGRVVFIPSSSFHQPRRARQRPARRNSSQTPLSRDANHAKLRSATVLPSRNPPAAYRNARPPRTRSPGALARSLCECSPHFRDKRGDRR